MKSSYIVFKSCAGTATNRFRVIRQDGVTQPPTKIGGFASRREAVTCARLLAGRVGRVAFTTDVTTYPFQD